MQADEDFNGSRVILFNLNRTYREDMTDEELYEITRCCWWLAPARAQNADYALAVYRGVIIQAYKIDPDSWEEVETQNPTIRWKFTGRVAVEPGIRRYIDQRIVFPGRNPVWYRNC